MATCIVWLKDKLKILWNILLYLVIEVITICSNLILSIAFCHWSTKIILLVTRYKLGNIGQIYLVITTVGILAVHFPKSWRLSLTPVSLEDFQETHPALFGVIKVIVVIASLFVFIALQFYTYHFKYDLMKDVTNEPITDNDILFLLSLSITAFILARVLQFYRDFNRHMCQRQISPIPLRKPYWFIYFFYYFSLLFLELVFTAPVFVCMTSFTLLCNFIMNSDCATYIGTAVLGYAAGHLLGVLEELYFPLDRYYQRFEPYFTTIHWDSRLNVLIFTLIPLLSRWYFFRDDNPEGDVQQNYNFFCGSMATVLLAFSKYQTLFSYVAAKAVHAEATVASASSRSPPDNRVYPETRSPVNPNQPTSNCPQAIPNSNVYVRRTNLCHYFPVNLQRSKPSAVVGAAAERDETSVSTGTCTSLVNRVSNNNGTQAEVATSIANSLTSSLVTCPRSPEQTQQLQVSIENEVSISSKNNNNENATFVATHEEAVMKTPEELDKENDNFSPVSNSNEITEPESVPQSQTVKLKRCPPDLLPILIEND